MRKQKKVFSLNQLLILLICFFAIPTQAQWQLLGLPEFSTSPVFSGTGFDFDVYSGTPYVVFTDNTVSNKITVMKHDGNAWVNIGGQGISTGEARYPTIAIDESNGDLFIGFEDYSFNKKTTVMKYDGGSWAYVGNPGFSSSESRFQRLTVNNSTPYIVYEDSLATVDATCMKYDGSAWVLVGTPGFTAAFTQGGIGQCIMPRLTFSPQDELYMAYMDVNNSPSFYNTMVVKFDGNNWNKVGSTSFSNVVAKIHNLDFDSTGAPYTVYLGFDNFKLTCKKFDGSNWNNVGPAGFTPDMGPSPSLAVHKNIPYVAYSDFSGSSELTVLYYDNSNWVPVGGNIQVSSGGVGRPLIRIDGNTIYVVYIDDNANKMSCMTYDLVLNAEEIQALNKSFSFSPNPARKQLFVQTPIDAEQISILNMQGQILKKKSINSNSSKISIEDLPSGVYLLQVKMKDGFGHQKFVKQ
jgi:hypothetical protein